MRERISEGRQDNACPPSEASHELGLHQAAPDQLLSGDHRQERERRDGGRQRAKRGVETGGVGRGGRREAGRSEEHTSELQSHSDLVCRLLLEKKKKRNNARRNT